MLIVLWQRDILSVEIRVITGKGEISHVQNCFKSTERMEKQPLPQATYYPRGKTGGKNMADEGIWTT
jgi:hypothetical protein